MVFDILLYLVWIALLAAVSAALYRHLERKQLRKARLPVSRQDPRRRSSGPGAIR